jgi:hypothetical protein
MGTTSSEKGLYGRRNGEKSVAFTQKYSKVLSGKKINTQNEVIREAFNLVIHIGNKSIIINYEIYVYNNYFNNPTILVFAKLEVSKSGKFV